MTKTVIAYDADIEYDSGLVYYDGSDVRWLMHLSQFTGGIELSEVALGNDVETELTTGDMDVSDE